METITIDSPGMAQELDRDKMRERRKELGLNQTQASEAAGFVGGASWWSDIEAGRRPNVTIATLHGIAKALRCDARDLITPPDKGQVKRKGAAK